MTVPFKEFFEKIANIFKIQELKTRILYTIGLLAVYRLGSYVTLPGINSSRLSDMFNASQGEGILGMLDMFVGGAFSRGAIFALGIMPYISASIIVQLLGFAVPYFQRLQSKEGESGRKKINQFTRLLTIIICVFQAPGYILTSVDASARPDSFLWLTTSVIILTAGCLFVMWLGERITDKGIGNGISLLIMIGIIATLPRSFVGEIQGQLANSGFFILLCS